MAPVLLTVQDRCAEEAELLCGTLHASAHHAYLPLPRYYKVAAEALRVCSSLALALRSEPGEKLPASRAEAVGPLFRAIMSRLQAQEQDQVTA